MQHNNNQINSIEKRREEELKQNEKIKEDMLIACKYAFAGNNGKCLGKFLKKICLWSETQNSSIDVNPNILAYQKGRRDIWLILREFIAKEDLAKIEIYD